MAYSRVVIRWPQGTEKTRHETTYASATSPGDYLNIMLPTAGETVYIFKKEATITSSDVQFQVVTCPLHVDDRQVTIHATYGWPVRPNNGSDQTSSCNIIRE